MSLRFPDEALETLFPKLYPVAAMEWGYAPAAVAPAIRPNTAADISPAPPG